MRNILIIAAIALAAGCATNETEADVTATSTTAPSAPTIEPGSQEDLEQTAGHRVFFAYDQYTLTPQAQAALRKQAEWLNANPGVRIRLEGNCDERGTREYNLALGAKRAEAARNYLVSLGVDASRLITVSNGKEKPIAMASDEYSWSQNRNSTTIVVGVSG